MYGVIPDARSIAFNIWRDYEDIRIFDVSSFLRLNHSRLLVSSLKWRPELLPEIRVNAHFYLYSLIKICFSNNTYSLFHFPRW